MNPTDQVREIARVRFVEPARKKRASTFEIVAGDVHRELGFSNRVPLVCNALRSGAFLVANHLELVKWDGPPSGQSTTVRFTYRFIDRASSPRPSSFLALRGIGKEVFRSLGGAEAFIGSEREKFYDGEHPK